MNPNVFYYQTDAFENQEDNKEDQAQNIDEQIEYFLSDQFSDEEKKIKISEIISNLQKQLKKAESERDQWKDKHEKQIKKLKKLQNFSKDKIENVSLTRSFSRHKSPKKQFHSNISIKKSPLNKKTFDLNFEQQKQRNVISTRKSLKPSKSMKSSSVNISINKKLEKETNTLQKYKKFVHSIGKIILQFKPKDFDKQSSQSLQDIWKWLKQHFEEYIDLKMKVIKLEKNNYNSNNNSNQSKIKKLFKGMNEDEIIKQIKQMKQNLKILEQIFQKSQSYLGFKNSKKNIKNYQKFDKFLDKHLKVNKQLLLSQQLNFFVKQFIKNNLNKQQCQTTIRTLCILKRKKDVVREHILKYYGSMLSPHERKLKQVQKVPQFNQSQKRLQKKNSKKDKSFAKSQVNVNSNKKLKKSIQKETDFQNDDLTKEMNEICESDRLKCQNQVQKTLSERFEQQFLDSLQEPIQAQDIVYTKENALDKLFSSFKSVKIQHDLNYDSLFFNSTKDKNYDSVREIQEDQSKKECTIEETTNDRSQSFLKNKNKIEEFEEIQQNISNDQKIQIDNVQDQNTKSEQNQQYDEDKRSNSNQNKEKEVNFLQDNNLDMLIQQESEKFQNKIENKYDAQTKFSKMFDKYRKQSQDSENDEQEKQQKTQTKYTESEGENNQDDDFLRLEKELHITPNDSIEQEKHNQKKEKYDSSRFVPAQIGHIQQQEEENTYERLPSFGNTKKSQDFQENFNFQENDENQDILQEINRIYKNSQSQSNVESIKQQYKSNGSFNYSQQDFLEKQQDLSKIIEEGEEKHIEEEEEDQYDDYQEQQHEKAEVFTLGGPNVFKESHRDVIGTVEELPEEFVNHNNHHHNAYYSDAVKFQTKPQHDTKNFKSMPDQNNMDLDEEQIRSQKFDELIEMMLRRKVRRIIQAWRNYKSPLNQKKYLGRFFDLYWNTYYDEDLVDAFNEGEQISQKKLNKIKNEFWIYLKQNMNMSRKDFEEEINKLSFFKQFNQLYSNFQNNLQELYQKA